MVKTLTSQNLEQSAKVMQLEQLLCAKEDQDAKHDELVI